jgi:hypothetical protein
MVKELYKTYVEVSGLYFSVPLGEFLWPLCKLVDHSTPHKQMSKWANIPTSGGGGVSPEPLGHTKGANWYLAQVAKVYKTDLWEKFREQRKSVTLELWPPDVDDTQAFVTKELSCISTCGVIHVRWLIFLWLSLLFQKPDVRSCGSYTVTFCSFNL